MTWLSNSDRTGWMSREYEFNREMREAFNEAIDHELLQIPDLLFSNEELHTEVEIVCYIMFCDQCEAVVAQIKETAGLP